MHKNVEAAWAQLELVSAMRSVEDDIANSR